MPYFVFSFARRRSNLPSARVLRGNSNGGSDAETCCPFGSAPLALIDVSFAYILEETWSIVLVGCLRIQNDSCGVHWVEAGSQRTLFDESSLANPYRQRSCHRSLDDIDGSNGFGIHQIEIFILMAGNTCRTCAACSLMATTFRSPRAIRPPPASKALK